MFLDECPPPHTPRTIGLYRSAVDSVANLSPKTLAIMQAYVDGVNAYLRDASLALPFEFLLFGVKPTPFTLADIVA